MDVTFPMLDVRKLIMLEAVMAEGSIAAAARRLQYTRSAVSQQVSALEAEAGTPLIDRAGNRITLTPAGRALVEHAERILVELRSAENERAACGRRRAHEFWEEDFADLQRTGSASGDADASGDGDR